MTPPTSTRSTVNTRQLKRSLERLPRKQTIKPRKDPYEQWLDEQLARRSNPMPRILSGAIFSTDGSSHARGDDRNRGLIDSAADMECLQRLEWLIFVGICTHLGCVPLGQCTIDPLSRYQGWSCPCRGSVYDVSGRARRGAAKPRCSALCVHG